MKPFAKVTKPLLPQAFRQRIAAALSGHLAAHLPGQPTRISLEESPLSNGKLGGKSRFVAVAVLPIYVAQLHQLARTGLANLEPSGFLLLVRSPLEQHLLVEVGKPNRKPPAIRVVSGDSVNSLQRALTTLAALPKQKHSSVRILRVPSLHLYAVWCLTPSAQQKSQCVPFTANFAGLKIGRRYSAGRLEKILQNAAMRIILLWYERSASARAGEKSVTLRNKADSPAKSAGRHKR